MTPYKFHDNRSFAALPDVCLRHIQVAIGLETSSASLKVDDFVLKVKLLNQTCSEMAVELSEVVHGVVVVFGCSVAEPCEHLDHP